VSTCAVCRWENDVDSGACAGCGADLATGTAPAASSAAAPGPAPIPPARDTVEPSPRTPTVAPVRTAVPIHPAGRVAPRVVEPSRGGPRSVERPRTAPLPPPEPESIRRAPSRVSAIPVVVAPAGERPAVRPRAGEPAGPAPEQVLPGPGGTMCRSCGRPVAAGRRFCRCGGQVSTAAAREASSPVAAVQLTRSAFRRAQRVANGGRRPRYDAPLAAQAWLMRGLGALLIVGAVGSQLPPWGADVRDWVGTRVEQVIPGD
jgi:hypothetical protein